MSATALQTQIADAIAKVTNFVSGFVATDLAVASDLAKAQGDTAGVAAYAAIAKILPTQIPAGAGIAYFVQVARGFGVNQQEFNAAVGPVFPALVKYYNDAVSQLYLIQNATTIA